MEQNEAVLEDDCWLVVLIKLLGLCSLLGHAQQSIVAESLLT